MHVKRCQPLKKLIRRDRKTVWIQTERRRQISLYCSMQHVNFDFQIGKLKSLLSICAIFKQEIKVECMLYANKLCRYHFFTGRHSSWTQFYPSPHPSYFQPQFYIASHTHWLFASRYNVRCRWNSKHALRKGRRG